MDKEIIKNEIDSIVEDIQEAIVDAGGNFHRRKEIEKMTVRGLLEVLIPNNVRFSVKHIPEIKPV